MTVLTEHILRNYNYSVTGTIHCPADRYPGRDYIKKSLPPVGSLFWHLV
jgi:hypothetical protein